MLSSGGGTGHRHYGPRPLCGKCGLREAESYTSPVPRCEVCKMREWNEKRSKKPPQKRS